MVGPHFNFSGSFRLYLAIWYDILRIGLLIPLDVAPLNLRDVYTVLPYVWFLFPGRDFPCFCRLSVLRAYGSSQCPLSGGHCQRTCRWTDFSPTFFTALSTLNFLGLLTGHRPERELHICTHTRLSVSYIRTSTFAALLLIDQLCPSYYFCIPALDHGICSRMIRL